MRIRISLVDYLNAAPLGWALLHGPFRDHFEVVPAPPSGCADQLARGEVDAGLIPSIEYQRIPGLAIVPQISIAALNRVRSVVLVRPHGKEELRSVALDHNSRTSAVLVKLWLELKMRLRPEYLPHSPQLPQMLMKCDAALVIGDAALKIPPAEYQIADLGEAWHGWQGKPFVFAIWACRQNAALPGWLTGALNEAKSWGLSRRAEIAEDYSRRLALPVAMLREYLSDNVDYELQEEHLEGMARFYMLAHGAGIIPRLEPIRFTDF